MGILPGSPKKPHISNSTERMAPTSTQTMEQCPSLWEADVRIEAARICHLCISITILLLLLLLGTGKSPVLMSYPLLLSALHGAGYSVKRDSLRFL